ncbi:MAG: hypothetical protein J6S56_05720 [Bacteroidales bacterium]|nr:hypothetical protein [Bacteroidales bacterium]
MKKNLTLFFLLVGFALGGVAQNQYWNYQSFSFTTHPTSTACIAHSDGKIYFFQTDPNHMISVAQINASNMQLTSPLHHLCHFDNIVSIRGGFEDRNNNYVLYGRNDSLNQQRSAVYFLDKTFSNNLVAYVFPNTLGYYSFIDGCRGFDANNNQVYMFVCDDGSLCAFHPNNLQHPVIMKPDSGRTYTDISWDDSHHCFIASGKGNTAPYQKPALFVDVFSFDIPTALAGGSPMIHHVSYTLFNHCSDASAEFKAMHAKIDDENLVVYHDLREEYYDALWMTRINNYWNGSRYYTNSRAFFIPMQKLEALDMVYDETNNRLNFLGRLINEGTTHFLSQVDPYSLTNMVTGQLAANFASTISWFSMAGPWQYFYGSKLTAEKLVWNPQSPCASILIPGIVNNTSFLTETYDISRSACDLPLEVWETDDHPTLLPTNIQESFVTDTVWTIIGGETPDSYSMNILCEDPEVCSNWHTDRNMKRDAVVTLQHPMIIIEGTNSFRCEHFKGVIRYSVTDMTGSMIRGGTTQNEEMVRLSDLHGFFLIHAVDKEGNEDVKKIVIFD